MSNTKSFTQKRKQDRLSKELGRDSLQEAYDRMFEMVEFVIDKQGYISHQINGLEFKKGALKGVAG